MSDIHGNLEALTSVWSKIEDLGLSSDVVLNAGDTVAHGVDSSACIDFIRSRPQIISVGGNYDYNVARYSEKKKSFAEKWAHSRPDKLEYLRRASEEITNEQRQWLRDLPKQLIQTLAGMNLFLSHYSPVGKKIGLGTWTSEADLEQISAQSSFDIVVVGHTHTPFVRRAGSTLFVNPGSVGMSWSEPTFAVLTIDMDGANGVINS